MFFLQLKHGYCTMLWCANQVRTMCNRYGFAGGFRVAGSANTTRAKRRGKAREGVARCGRRRVAALIPFCAGLVCLTVSKQKGWKMV